ncbi:MAG: S8 family serine peptidase, partial [Aliifodinibius sp.]|nr:S8 family serine peptidase [candidate division Zixibacteria bacterium]NIT55948.1 S8 family serine peptidase [Fodinibius sp.]NIW44090.1 S8 family serine peptidase [Gammaproteobacteria bacterium]NIS45132.1 S8 family serine peptidase [candidate division Zixibacteria bacterium]NIU13292.1 S8 family serine peptidase [candidate division Zixibacteria bacterium]
MFIKNLFWVVLSSLLLPLLAFAQQQNDYMEGHVVFKVTTPFTNIEPENGIVSTNESWFNSIAQQYQISELRPIFHHTGGEFVKYYLAVFDSSYTVDEVVNTLESESGVIFAEPDYIFEIFGNPNDPFFSLQWGLTKIQADLAWNIESGNSSVIVGVVDTGTDLVRDNGNPHPDLINNLWNGNPQFGYNATDPGQLPDDENGHGTHVAGIIGAETNNPTPTGIAGMAGGGFGGGDGIQIMTVRAGRRDGFIHAAYAAPAIIWAADPDGDPATDDGADIINMSWGRIIDPGNLIRDAI